MSLRQRGQGGACLPAQASDFTSGAAAGHGASGLVLAGVLFVAIFLLRLLISNPEHPIALLYAIPVLIVAIELGTLGGVGAALFAVVLAGVWDLGISDAPNHDVEEYVHPRRAGARARHPRSGALASHLRASIEAQTRFWELSSDLLATADETRLVPARQPLLDPRARLERRGADLAPVRRLRPPRRPRVHPQRAAAGDRDGRGLGHRQPLPAPRRRVPDRAMERQGRAGHGHDLRGGPRHHRARRDRGAAAGRGRAREQGERGEERVPLADEPRAADAAQRDPRLHAAARVLASSRPATARRSNTSARAGSTCCGSSTSCSRSL